MGSAILAAAVNLDSPGRYLHWNVFTVSLANLVLIAVMVVIFGAALLLPFPGRKTVEAEPLPAPEPDAASWVTEEADPEVKKQWTYRLRTMTLRHLPPSKLLPDRQPAYVASWVYVFGVATLAALLLCIVSGFAIAIGGTDWWHTNPVGHFFNSLHLWSVELFMAFMVIHLWGKFWMAAWRGKRGWTWITGVVAFVASVVEAFTGYLSQQNFDSQWISTNGKDAFNAAGVGAFFNLMNFGQMLLWHVVLVPIILLALVGAHILLVRAKGVAHPLPRRRTPRRVTERADRGPWRGPMRRYDIVKEGTIAVLVATVLVVVLAGLLSSPDEPSITLQSWAKVAPADFLGTAASELQGTSETAQYGPPYNDGTGNVQSLFGVSWQKLVGVRQPINPAEDFVLHPLASIEHTNLGLRLALQRYQAASSATRQAWLTAYDKALMKVRFVGGLPVIPPAKDGPVPTMLRQELLMAQSGALDAGLVANQSFYGTNFTKPLLFLEDGNHFSDVAQADHLTGTQWGVMNETGSYPGQPWLWLYQLWYQLPGLRSSANVDLIAIYLTGLATVVLLAVPFLPGLRDIPRFLPLHRLVWRGQAGEQPVEHGPEEPPLGGGDGQRPRAAPESALGSEAPQSTGVP